MTAHQLRYNGAAHDDLGNVIGSSKSTAGEGRGACSCGQLSEILPNGQSRRRWHKWHKENAAKEQPVQEETAMTENENPIPEEPVEELIEEEPEAVEAAAEEAVAEEIKDLIGEDEPEAEPVKEHKFTVPFTHNLAKHFWIPMGVKGTREFLAKNFPEVKAKADHKHYKVLLTGPDALDVATAAELIQEMWEAAAVDFRRWKKETPEYQALNHTVKADRATSYQITRAYFIEFGKNYEF